MKQVEGDWKSCKVAPAISFHKTKILQAHAPKPIYFILLTTLDLLYPVSMELRKTIFMDTKMSSFKRNLIMSV